MSRSLYLRCTTDVSQVFLRGIADVSQAAGVVLLKFNPVWKVIVWSVVIRDDIRKQVLMFVISFSFGLPSTSSRCTMCVAMRGPFPLLHLGMFVVHLYS
jgi:hypothetical protein